MEERFNKLIQQSTTWKCDLLYNEAKNGNKKEQQYNPPLAAATTEDQQQDNGSESTAANIVNLSVDYFAKQKTYIFPEHYCGPEEEQHLEQSLKIASLKCGFTLVRRTSKNANQLKETKYGADIMMACQSHQPYQDKSTMNKQCTPQRKRGRRTSTILPSCKKNACKFVFHLRMFKVDHCDYPGRWIAVPGKQNDGFHRGHWCFETKVLSASTKLMTNNERELATQCSEASIPQSASKALINVRNTDGMNFTCDQIRYVTRAQQEAELSKISSAQDLICALDKMDDEVNETIVARAREESGRISSLESGKLSDTQLYQLKFAGLAREENFTSTYNFEPAQSVFRFRRFARKVENLIRANFYDWAEQRRVASYKDSHSQLCLSKELTLALKNVSWNMLLHLEALVRIRDKELQEKNSDELNELFMAPEIHRPKHRLLLSPQKYNHEFNNYGEDEDLWAIIKRNHDRLFEETVDSGAYCELDLESLLSDENFVRQVFYRTEDISQRKNSREYRKWDKA